MMKKIFKVILIISISIFIFIKVDSIYAVNQNSSLKDLKNSMAKLDKKRQQAAARKNQSKIWKVI